MGEKQPEGMFYSALWTMVRIFYFTLINIRNHRKVLNGKVIGSD